MAQSAASPPRARAAAQGRSARVRQWLRRAAGSDGHERHTLELIGKSTLAATISWLIAYDVMHAVSPAFAPFSAILIMQVTVYQSVTQALRYVGAVSAGVALQAALGLLAGPDLLTFALVALVALSIGRWRPLGSQGPQVATAALFAFSTYVSASSSGQALTQLGQIILLVFIGCGVGVLVNLLVLPPLRYRSAEYGIHTLAQSLCDLISDIYPALKEEEGLEKERTAHWRRRAASLGSIVAQAQSSVNTARESIYYNPRQLFRRKHGHHVTFDGYQAVVDALERVSYQVASMTRSLDQEQDEDERTGQEQRRFYHAYGDLLASLAHITGLFIEIDEDRLTDQAKQLCKAASEAQEVYQQLAKDAQAGSLRISDPSYPYGILLAEAARLMHEFQYTCDILQHGVDHRAQQKSSRR
ncbi:aromatic acid exporter family protein [Streptomyces sp. NBC_01471]|uniref:FUSC family protein n=1 Tax=Streptomyces sp. NBC_01471 TaxID=2903879 RepID=UPI003254BD0E